MIYLSANLSWPFKYDPKFYGDYLYKTWKLTKNKCLEEPNRINAAIRARGEK